MVEGTYDGMEIERARVIVRKFYPEMKPTYAGRRVMIAIEAERAGKADTARIQALEAENARLREVLRVIAGMYPDWNSERMALVRSRARQALGDPA